MSNTMNSCCICFENKSTVQNRIEQCNQCHIFAHAKCYGKMTYGENKQWTCNKCIYMKQSDDIEIKCEICPFASGALKQTIDNNWVHILCALYIEEIAFTNVNEMTGIDIGQLPYKKFHNKCFICAKRQNNLDTAGATIKCVNKNCDTYFHIICAAEQNLLKEKLLKGGNINYCGYCDIHSPKSKIGAGQSQLKISSTTTLNSIVETNNELQESTNATAEKIKFPSERKSTDELIKSQKKLPLTFTEKPLPILKHSSLDSLQNLQERKKSTVNYDLTRDSSDSSYDDNNHIADPDYQLTSSDLRAFHEDLKDNDDYNRSRNSQPPLKKKKQPKRFGKVQKKVAKPKMSFPQKKLLLDRLEENKFTFLGRFQTLEGKTCKLNKWKALAIELNEIGPAVKDASGWQKSFTDLRSAVKNKIRSWNTSAKQTGGGPPSDVKFDDFDEQVMRLSSKEVYTGTDVPELGVDDDENIGHSGNSSDSSLNERSFSSLHLNDTPMPAQSLPNLQMISNTHFQPSTSKQSEIKASRPTHSLLNLQNISSFSTSMKNVNVGGAIGRQHPTNLNLQKNFAASASEKINSQWLSQANRFVNFTETQSTTSRKRNYPNEHFTLPQSSRQGQAAVDNGVTGNTNEHSQNLNQAFHLQQETNAILKQISRKLDSLNAIEKKLEKVIDIVENIKTGENKYLPNYDKDNDNYAFT